MNRPVKILPAAVSDLPEVQNGLFRVAKDGKIYRRKDDHYILAPQSMTGRGKKRAFVSGYVDGKQKNFRVYRLVAEAYIPNPEGKPAVNHKDGNALNNHVDNLEWCTYSENTMHAYATGLLPNLETAGAPCVSCGINLVLRSRICRDCKKEALRRSQKRQRLDDTAEDLEPAIKTLVSAGADERDIKILEMRLNGATLHEIGLEFGITRERVRQLIGQIKERSQKARLHEEQLAIGNILNGMCVNASAFSRKVHISSHKIRSLIAGVPSLSESEYNIVCGAVKATCEAISTMTSPNQAS